MLKVVEKPKIITLKYHILSKVVEYPKIYDKMAGIGDPGSEAKKKIFCRYIM